MVERRCGGDWRTITEDTSERNDRDECSRRHFFFF